MKNIGGFNYGQRKVWPTHKVLSVGQKKNAHKKHYETVSSINQLQMK
jgi:hypothetical protein